MEQKLLTLPEHLSSPPVFNGVRVTRSLVLYVCFVDRCLSFCPFYLGIVLSVLLRYTYSDCPSSNSSYDPHCVDTSAGELLVTEGIIRPVVNASALTWFIRCIFYRNLQFLIIIKTYGFPSSCIGDLSRFLAIMFNFFQFNSILDPFKICFLAPN